MKKHVKSQIKVIATLALALTSTQGLAQQWMWESGALTSDGSVQVQAMSGGAAMTLTQNPTGAAAMTSMSALTQPPTVLNAMATLPIVQEHTACDMSATEGDTAGVNADRTLLLTCRPNPNAANALQWMRQNPPEAVEGQPCLSSTGQPLENGAIGKTSTGLLLSCQSGMWKKGTGSNDGLRGVFLPHAGKTITCAGSASIRPDHPSVVFSDHSIQSKAHVYARVLSDGTPQTRVSIGVHNSCDSGWVSGLAASCRFRASGMSYDGGHTTGGTYWGTVSGSTSPHIACGNTPWPM